jgi:UDP-N-acetylmuramoyl-tripeptide--D-alanyl-D-alanine ligase
MLGAHNAMNALAGLAVALEAGVDLEAAIAALASLTAGDKRGEIHRNQRRNHSERLLQLQPRGAALDDSHPGRAPSQAPDSGGRRDARNGRAGPALHAACGRAAAEAGLDLVAGVGGNAEHLAAAACAGGVAALFLPDAEAAGRWLKQNLQPGDVVLVKGSRGVHLERAIEFLKKQVTDGEEK